MAESNEATQTPQRTRGLFVAAFAMLGFTSSIMNSLTDTPGATQSYLSLLFTFVGATALLYAGATHADPNLTAARVAIATHAVLAMCCGVLLGLFAGFGLKYWARTVDGAMAEPSNTIASTVSPGSAATETSTSAVKHGSTAPLTETITLHAATPCTAAKNVLNKNRPWLTEHSGGNAVLAQYELLLRLAKCVP